MIPLLRAGDRTRSLKEIRVGVIEDPTIAPLMRAAASFT
jgi:hypothetical protein